MTRTVRIAFPFAILRVKMVRTAMLLYALMLIILTPAFYGINHYYRFEWCALALNKSRFRGGHHGDVTYFTSVMSIPTSLLIPIPISIISAVCCSVKILSRKGQSRNTRRQSIHSAITVIILTLTYLVFNLPYAAIYLYFQLKMTSGIPANDVFKNQFHVAYTIGFTHILSISLNASLNPVIYYYRIAEFKESVRSGLARAARVIRRRYGREEIPLNQYTGTTQGSCSENRSSGQFSVVHPGSANFRYQVKARHFDIVTVNNVAEEVSLQSHERY